MWVALFKVPGYILTQTRFRYIGKVIYKRPGYITESLLLRETNECPLTIAAFDDYVYRLDLKRVDKAVNEFKHGINLKIRLFRRGIKNQNIHSYSLTVLFWETFLKLITNDPNYYQADQGVGKQRFYCIPQLS